MERNIQALNGRLASLAGRETRRRGAGGRRGDNLRDTKRCLPSRRGRSLLVHVEGLTCAMVPGYVEHGQGRRSQWRGQRHGGRRRDPGDPGGDPGDDPGDYGDKGRPSELRTTLVCGLTGSAWRVPIPVSICTNTGKTRAGGGGCVSVHGSDGGGVDVAEGLPRALAQLPTPMAKGKGGGRY